MRMLLKKYDKHVQHIIRLYHFKPTFKFNNNKSVNHVKNCSCSDLSQIHAVTNQYLLTINSLNTGCQILSYSSYVTLTLVAIHNCCCNDKFVKCKQTANSHSMTRQFHHSSNVECGRIVRNSPVFTFELCHIPNYDNAIGWLLAVW